MTTDAIPTALARRRARLHPVTILAVLALGVPVVAMTVTYGTPSPCEALRKELRVSAFRAAGPASVLQMASAAPTFDAVAEALVAQMGPLDCARGLIRLKFNR